MVDHFALMAYYLALLPDYLALWHLKLLTLVAIRINDAALVEVELDQLPVVWQVLVVDDIVNERELVQLRILA